MLPLFEGDMDVDDPTCLSQNRSVIEDPPVRQYVGRQQASEVGGKWQCSTLSGRYSNSPLGVSVTIKTRKQGEPFVRGCNSRFIRGDDIEHACGTNSHNAFMHTFVFPVRLFKSY